MRRGRIDSVHTFAQSDVGDYFIVALVVLAVVSIGLIVWRVVDGSLKSTSEVDSLRENHFPAHYPDVVFLPVSMRVVRFGAGWAKSCWSTTVVAAN